MKEYTPIQAKIEAERCLMCADAPCGTVELARLAIWAFEKGRPVIMLKNHGYVATSSDLDKTCDLIISTHLKLSAKKG